MGQKLDGRTHHPLKTRVRKVFKTLEQAKAWRDIKLKERIVGK